MTEKKSVRVKAKAPATDSTDASPSWQILRQQAETRLKKQPLSDAPEPQDTAQLSYELQVHQIELEMQNEELRRAQAELAESRDRYFNLYDLAPVGYLTLNEEGLILEANLTAATLLGPEKSALVTQPLSRFIAAEDQDTYYLKLRKLFTTQQPQACDLRIAHTDEPLRWVRMEATVAPAGERGAVARIVLSDISERKQIEDEIRRLNRDLEQRVSARTAQLTATNQQLEAEITERRRTEASLRASESKLRLLIEQANDAIFIENEDDEILDVNTRACELLGYSRAELLAMKVPDLMPPEIRGAPGRVIKGELASNQVIETVGLRKDGTHVPLEISTRSALPAIWCFPLRAILPDANRRKRRCTRRWSKRKS